MGFIVLQEQLVKLLALYSFGKLYRNTVVTNNPPGSGRFPFR